MWVCGLSTAAVQLYYCCGHFSFTAAQAGTIKKYSSFLQQIEAKYQAMAQDYWAKIIAGAEKSEVAADHQPVVMIESFIGASHRLMSSPTLPASPHSRLLGKKV